MALPRPAPGDARREGGGLVRGGPAIQRRRHRGDAPESPGHLILKSRAEAGRSIRFFVPDPVWRYVEDHELYALR